MTTKTETDENIAREVQKLEKRIKELTRSKTKLLEKKKQYQTIIETLQDGYYETDLKGNITFHNKPLRKALGYSKKELNGKNYRAIIVKKEFVYIRRMFNKVYSTGKHQMGIIYRHINKDGSKGYAEAYISPIYDKKGKTCGFSGIARNVTRRIHMEKQLREAHEKLEKRVKDRTKKLSEINRILEIKTSNLEEANIALRVLLDERKNERSEIEEKVLLCVTDLVLPYIEELKKSGLKEHQMKLADIIEKKLKDIVSPFAQSIASGYYKLTPSEIIVADQIRSGKTTKEIAGIRNLSVKTIEFHRENLRNKLGIKNSKTNLRTFLEAVG
jgi:PAS domain S-box-containing protein